MKKVNVNGKVVLIANIDGKFYALNNVCPHSGGSLADGKLNGNVVTCPKHGAQFNVKRAKRSGKQKFCSSRQSPPMQVVTKCKSKMEM